MFGDKVLDPFQKDEGFYHKETVLGDPKTQQLALELDGDEDNLLFKHWSLDNLPETQEVESPKSDSSL